MSKNYPTFADRSKASNEAKAALLSKFKQKTAEPVNEEEQKAKLAEALARSAKRQAAEEARRARVAQEKEQRALEAELKRIEAEEAAKKAAEDAVRAAAEEAERLEILEAEQKARRDLRYAQRKARAGKR